jgi:hypothetical protein
LNKTWKVLGTIWASAGTFADLPLEESDVIEDHLPFLAFYALDHVRSGYAISASAEPEPVPSIFGGSWRGSFDEVRRRQVHLQQSQRSKRPTGIH